MSKFTKLIAILGVLMLLTVGCSKPADESTETKGDAKSQVQENDKSDNQGGRDIVIAGIYKDLSQVWFQGTSSNAKAKAVEMGAKDMLLIDAKMDADTYLNALDNIIAQEVDGLIVCVPDQKLSSITVEKCEAAGIPVIADDDGLIDEEGVHIAPALELDAYKVGRQQGEWMVNHVKDNDLIKDADKTGYLVMEMTTVSSTLPRSKGAADVWDESEMGLPEKNVIHGDYLGSTEEAFTIASAIITANPQIETWFATAPNDEGAAGVTRALEQAGLDENAVVSGLGGYLAKDEWKKDYSAFKSSGYFCSKEDGETVAEAMMNHIQNGEDIFAEYKKDGEKYPVYPLGAIMVTKDDYKEVMGADAE
ncbi:hypothetical protein SH1V18_10520 [Vallitalea longa]|uniref:Periplasmic binding protein domain-containing protein n=1 Tax=Vallitalea longa TaxID=2936439 RepID=A0A9W5Y872_9FIRM|nr:substrate-binding domain-containing protein [Vallitalea longa]GKX28572.1 hypothetical protein SH1V18_10520 [Vallitalea longa]